MPNGKGGVRGTQGSTRKTYMPPGVIYKQVEICPSCGAEAKEGEPHYPPGGLILMSGDPYAKD